MSWRVSEWLHRNQNITKLIPGQWKLIAPKVILQWGSINWCPCPSRSRPPRLLHEHRGGEEEERRCHTSIYVYGFYKHILSLFWDSFPLLQQFLGFALVSEETLLIFKSCGLNSGYLIESKGRRRGSVSELPTSNFYKPPSIRYFLTL